MTNRRAFSMAMAACFLLGGVVAGVLTHLIGHARAEPGQLFSVRTSEDNRFNVEAWKSEIQRLETTPTTDKQPTASGNPEVPHA